MSDPGVGTLHSARNGMKPSGKRSNGDAAGRNRRPTASVPTRAFWLAAVGAALCACTGGDDARERRQSAGSGAGIAEMMQVADPDRGARLFRTCAACHTVGRTAPDLAGPNLYAVMGKPIARNRPRFGYTAALKQKGGVWDVRAMSSWLEKPEAFAPGTRMRYAGLADLLDRADVIAYLSEQAP